MISNEFIPLSISSFHKYLLENFNLDINNIPNKEWNNLIYKNYCKNIINNRYCFKKIKKIDPNNIDICSKCCEKMKLKTYKKNKIKKCKKKEKINKDIDNNEDSGFYTETDNENYTNSKLDVTQNMMINLNPNKYNKNCTQTESQSHSFSLETFTSTTFISENCKNKGYIKFGDLNFKLNDKHLYLTDFLHMDHYGYNSLPKNYINNINNNIYFGNLKFKIDKKENKSENKICDSKLRKRILLKINILRYFKKLYLKNKDNEFNTNSDLYYVFLYIIDLIFRTKNINYIRKELYNCLGILGINYYRSQINKILL
jgi:hypothetical protein